MRYYFLSITILLLSCSKSGVVRNPYLQDLEFSYPVNMNLPLYNNLKTPLNAVYINVPGVGNKGVYVINTGTNNYVAWDAACPNHRASDCAAMSLSGGINVRCSCDDNLYSLVNGALISSESTERQYPLLNYRVSVSGNVLTVYN
ncbi:MAG: hypothetical protein Q4G08_01875 [Capnocytophaga sp.]|nr:hypothetical protein [Capnocytophaga sp.]